MKADGTDASSGLLVAVLATPPTTTGDRTRARVEMARLLLGFESSTIVNLLDVPTYRTGNIKDVGVDEEVWLASRPALSVEIGRAAGVLFGYGNSEPAGPARHHFRNQVAWVHSQVAETGLSAYTVSPEPRHPSRWHRWTHRARPGIDFAEALRMELRQSVVATPS